jgi:UDP:flavonoid glycosyltransferase YjiC (YdhE family)
MRVLFSPYPARSHFFPVVPFAWALQSAGHEVRIAAPGFFADVIAEAGLTPVSLGDPGAADVRLRDDARPPAGPEETMAYADAMGLDPAERENWIVFFQYMMVPLSDYIRLDLPDATELVSFAQVWKPDLVLWDPCIPAGAVAARTCGSAHGRFLGPSLDWYAYCSERLAARRSQVRAAGLAENPLADMVRPLAERYGVEVDEELLFGQWTVDALPQGLSLPNSKLRIPVRWMPYNGGETFHQWLYERPARPRVALSLGESTRRYVAGDWGRTPKLFEAVADLDVELVATLNKVQLGGVSRIPDNVRTIDWVSLTQLLPTCSAIVHHGGNGTFSAATAMKVPQIIWDTDLSLLLNPAAAAAAAAEEEGVYRIGREFGVREDTEDDESKTDWVHPAKNLQATACADYVTGHGGGARLNHLTQSPEEIRQVIQRVLSEPSFKAGAASIHKSWLAAPSPKDIVSVLEGLTAEYRRTR